MVFASQLSFVLRIQFIIIGNNVGKKFKINEENIST